MGCLNVYGRICGRQTIHACPSHYLRCLQGIYFCGYTTLCHFVVLHTAMCCAVYAILFCAILYSNVPYCIVLCYAKLCHTEIIMQVCRTALCSVPYCRILILHCTVHVIMYSCSVPHCQDVHILMCQAALCDAVLHCAVPYYRVSKRKLIPSRLI